MRSTWLALLITLWKTPSVVLSNERVGDWDLIAQCETNVIFGCFAFSQVFDKEMHLLLPLRKGMQSSRRRLTFSLCCSEESLIEFRDQCDLSRVVLSYSVEPAEPYVLCASGSSTLLYQVRDPAP